MTGSPGPASVVHVRRDEYDVYIGRANRTYNLAPSKWANPYKLGVVRDKGRRLVLVRSREEALVLYHSYVLAWPRLRDALGELRGKRLACWCAPLACHGDVLLAFLIEYWPQDFITEGGVDAKGSG